jgi:hypothetical protein
LKGAVIRWHWPWWGRCFYCCFILKKYVVQDTPTKIDVDSFLMLF